MMMSRIALRYSPAASTLLTVSNIVVYSPTVTSRESGSTGWSTPGTSNVLDSTMEQSLRLSRKSPFLPFRALLYASPAPGPSRRYWLFSGRAVAR